MEETAATKELKQMFTQIRDERRMYANTSSRIGDAFLSLLSYLDSFLKKDGDIASGLITFLKGIGLGNDFSIDELGNALLNTVKATDASISNILTDVLFKAGAKFSKGLSIGENYSIDSFGNAILNSLKSSNFDEVSQTGFSQTKDGLLLKNLTVWGKAIFNSLEIRKVYNVGGVFLASPAGGTIKKVEDKGTFYRCYLLADDGTTRTTNLFSKGDQALCQDFNIKSGVYSNVSNRRYWRKIIDLSTDDTLFDDGCGHKYAWVDLSKTDCEATTNDAPASGDVICTLGNDTDKDRQNAILLDTTSPGAPILALYKGVNTYSLENKDIVVLSPAKVKAVVNELYTVSETGEVTDTAKAISDNSDRITDVSKSVSDANDAMNTARAALQKEIDSNSADIKANAGTITSQGTQIQQTNGSLTTLAGRVTTTEKGITSNSTAIRQNSDSIGALSSRVTKTESGVSDNHSAILSNSDLIKTKVSQTDYDTNNQKIDTHFSAVEQTAKGISSSVTDVSNKVNANKTSTDKAISDTNDKVANIQVGGTNLILYSEVSNFGSDSFVYDSTNHIWTIDIPAAYSNRGYGFYFYAGSRTAINPGEYLTYSCEIYSDVAFTLDHDVNNVAIDGNNWSGNDNDDRNLETNSGFGSLLSAGAWHKVWFTIKARTDKTVGIQNSNTNIGALPQSSAYTIKVRHIKIEKGNKATDWSPAPEDVDASISKVDKRVDDVNTLLNNTKSDLQKDIDDNKTDADGKISAQGTKIDQTKSDVTTLAGRVTTTEKGISDNTAAIDVNAKAIKTKVSQTDYDDNNTAIQSKFSEIKQTTDGISLSVNSVSDTANAAKSAAMTAQKTADGKATPIDVANARSAAISAAATDATAKANEASGINKWILSKYVDSSLPYGADVSLEALSKLTPVSIIEDTDPGTSTFNQINGFSFNTDNYVGKATTYICFSADTDISHNLNSDDAGRVYINGNLIGKLVSTTNTSFTLPFKKGWNRVDLIWSEKMGGDGFSLLGLVLSTYTNVEKMTAYPKGELESLISKTYTDSLIKIVNGEISSKVSETDYDSNNQAIQSKFSEIKQTTDGISLTVSDVSNKADSASSAAATANATANSANSKADTINSGLSATGIDIRSHRITATVDNFTIKNNSGVTTFSVDKDGNLIGTGNASFSGKISSSSGKIGAWSIDSYGLVSATVGMNGGTIKVGDGSYHFLNINDTGELLAVRNDDGICASFYTSGSSGVGLDILGQEDSIALKVHGNAYLISRSGEYTYINGRAQGVAMISRSCTIGDSSCTALINGQMFKPSLVLCSGNDDYTINLPSSPVTGEEYLIRKVSAANIFVSGNGRNIKDCNRGAGGSMRNSVRLQDAQLGYFVYEGSWWVYNEMN